MVCITSGVMGQPIAPEQAHSLQTQSGARPWLRYIWCLDEQPVMGCFGVQELMSSQKLWKFCESPLSPWRDLPVLV